jgi:hypothetical protein
MMLLYDITRRTEPVYAAQALDLAKSQVDYILGANEFGRSFIHGFGTNSWDKVHHRNLQGIDDNPPDAVKESTPFKFKRGGALIGGPSGVGQFNNSVVNYSTTESGCDYNAGITGALAGLISINAPYESISAVAPRPARSTLQPGALFSVSAFRSGTTVSLVIKHQSTSCAIREISLFNAVGALKARKTVRSEERQLAVSTWRLAETMPGVYVCMISAGRSTMLTSVMIP